MVDRIAQDAPSMLIASIKTGRTSMEDFIRKNSRPPRTTYPHQDPVFHQAQEGFKRGATILAMGARKSGKSSLHTFAHRPPTIGETIAHQSIVKVLDESHLLKTDHEADPNFVHPEYNRISGDIEE